MVARRAASRCAASDLVSRAFNIAVTSFAIRSRSICADVGIMCLLRNLRRSAKRAGGLSFGFGNVSINQLVQSFDAQWRLAWQANSLFSFSLSFKLSRELRKSAHGHAARADSAFCVSERLRCQVTALRTPQPKPNFIAANIGRQISRELFQAAVPMPRKLARGKLRILAGDGLQFYARFEHRIDLTS